MIPVGIESALASVTVLPNAYQPGGGCDALREKLFGLSEWDIKQERIGERRESLS